MYNRKDREKRSEKSTKIHCGIDFIAQQEQEKENTRFQALIAKIEKIREIMVLPKMKADCEKKAKLEEMLQLLEEDQRKLWSRVSDFLNRTNADENATMNVYGEIAPGTLI